MQNFQCLHEEKGPFCLGLKVDAPWPEEMPKGVCVSENFRHIKIADFPHLSDQREQGLEQLHAFSLKRMVGQVGDFDSCFFLPSDQPQEVGWRAHSEELLTFQNGLLKELFFLHPKEEKEENQNPSMLLCRSPFDPEEWQKAFIPLPFKTDALHLYAQEGPLLFRSLWSVSFLPSFEEEEHTADMAFKIHGENLQEIYRHAFTALAFKIPELLPFFIPLPHIDHLDDIVIVLNQSVSAADAAIGCPLKAVSFHGDLVYLDPSTLQWEMIVDV